MNQRKCCCAINRNTSDLFGRWGLKCFPEKPEAPVNPPRPQADRVSPIQEDTTVRQPGKQGSPG